MDGYICIYARVICFHINALIQAVIYTRIIKKQETVVHRNQSLSVKVGFKKLFEGMNYSKVEVPRPQ